jgi:hypothetical protein
LYLRYPKFVSQRVNGFLKNNSPDEFRDFITKLIAKEPEIVPSLNDIDNPADAPTCNTFQGYSEHCGRAFGTFHGKREPFLGKIEACKIACDESKECQAFEFEVDSTFCTLYGEGLLYVENLPMPNIHAYIKTVDVTKQQIDECRDMPGYEKKCKSIMFGHVDFISLLDGVSLEDCIVKCDSEARCTGITYALNTFLRTNEEFTTCIIESASPNLTEENGEFRSNEHLEITHSYTKRFNSIQTLGQD